MPMNSSKPAIVPPIESIEYSEWRQVEATERWSDPLGPLSTSVLLRRCRRLPDQSLEDMTEGQEAILRKSDNTFSRDLWIHRANLFTDMPTNPSLQTIFGHKIFALQQYIDEIENPPVIEETEPDQE